MMRGQITRFSSGLILGVAVILAAQAQSAAEQKGASDERRRGGDYIDVTVKGTLKMGVMAIGAETTGATITSDEVTWELDLEGNQPEAASKLNGRKAIVSGRLRNESGVEVRNRFIIRVRSIKPAP
jgi:trans-2-enoyl-CoA reductase